METREILERIVKERERQNNLFKEQNHSKDRWCVILGEEYGEVCKANLENDEGGYIEELVQTAAVCVAAIESFYRTKVDK